MRVALSTRVIEAATRNVKDYKTYRHLLAQHVYHLTPWGKTNAWQVMQFAARDQRNPWCSSSAMAQRKPPAASSCAAWKIGRTTKSCD